MQFDYFGNQLDPSKFQARTGWYFGDFSLLASQVLNNQQITLRGTEMFFAVMRLMSVQTGAFRINLYTSTSERYMYNTMGASNDRVRYEAVFGTAQRPGVLPVPIIIPGSSSILFDLEDVTAAPNTLHLVFGGVRLFPLGN